MGDRDADDVTIFIHREERAAGLSLSRDDMIAVVGEGLGGPEERGLSDDSFPFHYDGPKGVMDDPFASKNSDVLFGRILDPNEVNEGKGAIFWRG